MSMLAYSVGVSLYVIVMFILSLAILTTFGLDAAIVVAIIWCTPLVYDNYMHRRKH